VKMFFLKAIYNWIIAWLWMRILFF
jgi:hypothetical protein